MKKNIVTFLFLGGIFFASYSFVQGADVEFANPLQFDTVEEVVGALLENLMNIIAFVAVLFIVIGGLMYMLAGGDDKKITAAKNTITSAIIGFAIAISAGTFLKEIQKILGMTPSGQTATALDLKTIIENTLNFLLSVIGIVAMIGLVVGGVFYLTAYGDEDRAKKGKSIITSSIIGIAIALAALVIVKQVFELITKTT